MIFLRTSWTGSDWLGREGCYRILSMFKIVPVLQLDGVTTYLKLDRPTTNIIDVLRTELPYFDHTRNVLQRDVVKHPLARTRWVL